MSPGAEGGDYYCDEEGEGWKIVLNQVGWDGIQVTWWWTGPLVKEWRGRGQERWTGCCRNCLERKELEVVVNRCEKFVCGGGRSFGAGGAKVNQSFKLMFVGFNLTGANQGAEWVNETAVFNLPSVNTILMNQIWKYHKLVFIVEETRAMQIHHLYISLLGFREFNHL